MNLPVIAGSISRDSDHGHLRWFRLVGEYDNWLDKWCYMVADFYVDFIAIGHDGAGTHLKGFDGVVVGYLDFHHVIDGDGDFDIVFFLDGYIVVFCAGRVIGLGLVEGFLDNVLDSLSVFLGLFDVLNGAC